MERRLVNLFAAAFAVALLCGSNAFAQSDWLDMQPLPNWSSRSRAILQTKRMPAEVSARCRKSIRAATLPADRLLTQQNWTLVGPAHVFGRTTVVTVAENFDGMCRPLQFQSLVFVGNRVAGTLSPGPMNSRTDGALTSVRMLSETELTAEYARYRESDPLCCPSKIEVVSFTVKPDGANFLLTPGGKMDAGSNNSGSSESGDKPPADATALKNTVWRWQSLATAAGSTEVDQPEKYQLEFTADEKVRVRADCNRGSGGYQADGGNLKFSPIALTRAMCPPGSLDNQFMRGLEAARAYRIEGNTLVLEGEGDNGTMRFLRVYRQN